MADDGAPAIQSIIDTFERRAIRRQLGAYGFLALMLAGIGAAAYVFVQAKEITDRETKSDIPAKISSIKHSIDENVHKQQEITNALAIMMMKMIREFPTKESCQKPFLTNPGSLRFSFFLEGRLQSTLQVANRMRSMPQSPANIDCLTFIYPNQQPVNIDFRQLQTVTSKEWESNDDPSPLEIDLEKIEHQGIIYNRALTTLQDALERQEASPLIGEPEAPKTPVSLSLPFLLQLNITRFGTITLVVIALGILAPLYRFSARLATFYRARADILRLHQIPGYKQTGIVRLSPIFTPTFDFGKSQAVPDHITELLRAAVGHGKDE